MTEPTISCASAMPADSKELAAWLTRLWVDALGSAIESTTAHRPVASIQPPQRNGWDIEGYIWWGQRLSMAHAPAFRVGASASSWKSLSQLVLKELGVDEATDDDLQTAVRDLLAQAANAFARHLTRELGEEVMAGDLRPCQPSGGSSVFFDLAIKVGLIPLAGTVLFDDAFLARLLELVQRKPVTAAMSEPAERSEKEAPPAQPRPARQDVMSLGGVKLRVRIILGRNTLSLKDVVKVSVGSVIELDRIVTDPADIMIGDHRIAQGRVVVVHGNYGIEVVAKEGKAGPEETIS